VVTLQVEPDVWQKEQGDEVGSQERHKLGKKLKG